MFQRQDNFPIHPQIDQNNHPGQCLRRPLKNHFQVLSLLQECLQYLIDRYHHDPH